MSGLFSRAAKPQVDPCCSCVIVAAGSSSRMGEDKMKLELGGIPVIARTLDAIEACPGIHEIVLVTHADNIVEMAKLCRDYGIMKATKIIVGGDTRTESVLAGLYEISTGAKLVAIHDGARPLVTTELVEETIAAAREHLAAAPAVPLRDTIKHVNSYSEADSTPPRAEFVSVQTPQVFEVDLIKAALVNAQEKNLVLTDDCSAVEVIGVKPLMTCGSEENIKITTPLDIKIAEAILAARDTGNLGV